MQKSLYQKVIIEISAAKYNLVSHTIFGELQKFPEYKWLLIKYNFESTL